MSTGKIGSPRLQQWYALNTLKANFWRKVNTGKGLDWLKHWNQYQQFTQHLRKHLPHIKYLFQENLQRKEFFKKINMMNLKGTTILLVWKVLLNQTVHMVILYAKYEDHVAFHKIVLNELHVPEVTACIRVDDKLHVKLFPRGSPVPLSQWFRYGHNCKLTSKSMLENFPSYLESQTENFLIFDNLKKVNSKRTKSIPVK